MKKFFTLLCVAFCATALFANVVTGTCGDNLQWAYDTDTHALTITGSGDMYWSDDRPWAQVVSEITSVSLPDGLTSIGSWAFNNCSSLTSVTIPNSVMSIGTSAFEDCSSLTSVTIGNSVTSIGKFAFFRCYSLNSITIPNSVTSIGMHAFCVCSSLTSIAIPNSITSIEHSTFRECSSLTTIIIPNSVKSIGNYAFDGCSSITSLTIPNSVTSIGSSAFSGCSSLTSITIPNSVMSIGNYAFDGCSALTSMVVESGNTTYDSRENCNAIIESSTNTLIAGCQNTVIPNSVTSIGNWAFSGCSSLTSITIPDGVKSIGNCAFKGCSSLSSFTIPNSVMRIEGQTFENCSSLTSVTIPNSVTSIGHDAFSSTGIYSNESNWENDVLYISNCLIEAKDNISGSYTIKDNTRLLADQAFNGCSSLTSITIPNSVTSIGINAFRVCSSFTTITIPNSVTSIGNRAFDGCSSLNTIYVEATTPSTLGYNVFTNTPSPACYIPCGTLTAYEASDWAEQVGGFVEQCDNNNDEQSSVSVTDGTAADWNNLPVEYLFETQCAEGSSWNALKSVKVYADSTYINLVVEWDTEIVTDLSSVPFQVYLNVDNDAPTGGFSDLWIKPNIDLLLEGNFYLDGFPCAYQPVVALYAGTPLANEWAWDLISIESVAANQLITKGVMEIQIDYGKLPVKLENTFTVGFSIQQSWTPVGVLPNAANDNTGNRVLAEKMLVRINNVNVSTPVENTELNSSNVQKIFRDGQVLILRDGKIYSVMGQEL